jgi:hypothetical protein
VLYLIQEWLHLESDWKSICKATTHITCTHLVFLDSSYHKGQQQKQIFYKHQFPVQWDNVMRELEKMSPPLSIYAVL